jgi:hypothetical protein
VKDSQRKKKLSLAFQLGKYPSRTHSSARKRSAKPQAYGLPTGALGTDGRCLPPWLS